MKVFGVVMAGGDGTRFWPLSRKETPKQLLNMSGKDAIINETIDRLMPAVTHETYIVTNRTQAENLKSIVKERVSSDHILIEPAARNTSACIGYAAFEILKKEGDAVMVITPSDSFIKNGEEYARILNIAVQYAEKTNQLVTIGITPTYPATGFGYIECGESDEIAKPVIRFVEKPDQEKAQEYIDRGDYVWNSGIFVWKASVILKKFKELLPDLYELLSKIADCIGTEEEFRMLDELYPQLRSISVDYGILEKAGNILVIPGEFGWYDVGSLDMLGVMHQADENGNVIIGNAAQIDTKNTIIYTKNKLVATVGLENMIVIDTPDITLVCPLDKAQEVKKIVEKLKQQGRIDLL